jgi:cation transport ATPase
MKKLMTVLVIAAIIVAFYEQTKPKPNIYITSAAVIIFMYGVARVSAKIPEKKDDDVQ